MLNNITLGQYYPVDSPIHRLDPRIKIILTLLMIVAVFMTQTLVGYALILLFVFFTAKFSHVPFKMLMKGLKPLRFILILTFLLNLFFTPGTELFHVGFVSISQEGLRQSIHYSLRLVFLVVSTSLLTLTTSPIALSDGLELLLSTLRVIHFPAHELAMMMSIALRFIPTLLEETDKIM
ncbi:MAG: energy-coupling factor transporter transmembrane protein EcfT [Clostridia bacterium]|nr:energy-coupling factor transporter transmembrane protein EcfT [Clostridia bacterium]